MTLLRALVVITAAIATFRGTAPGAAPAPPAVPSCDVMPGSTQEGASRLYEGDSLFEYMDGNSEGYFIYGFVRMSGVTCAQSSQKVLIDISEMKDEEGAYGIFCANLDTKLPIEQIGAGGQIVPRKAIFVKGKYFVEVTAQAQGDFTSLLSTTAKTLEKRLSGSTSVPASIGWFPSDGLTAGGPRLAPESVLGIRALHRGYVAQYGESKAFVVAEASDTLARQTMDKLRARFGSVQQALIGDEAFQAEDKYLGRICIARRGRIVTGYAMVPAASDSMALTRELLSRVPR